jgi:hypothetical protein
MKTLLASTGRFPPLPGRSRPDRRAIIGGRLFSGYFTAGDDYDGGNQGGGQKTRTSGNSHLVSPLQSGGQPLSAIFRQTDVAGPSGLRERQSRSSAVINMSRQSPHDLRPLRPH